VPDTLGGWTPPPASAPGFPGDFIAENESWILGAGRLTSLLSPPSSTIGP